MAKSTAVRAVLVFLFLSVLPSVATATLLVNEGFESGDLVPWTLSVADGSVVTAPDGNDYALLMEQEPGYGLSSLSQEIMLESGVVTATFDYAFAYFEDVYPPDLPPGQTLFDELFVGVRSDTYSSLYSIDLLTRGGSVDPTILTDASLDQASITFFWPDSGACTFGFFVTGHDGYVNYALALDNIRVSSPVPEPATALLLGGGLIGIVIFRKKIFSRKVAS